MFTAGVNNLAENKDKNIQFIFIRISKIKDRLERIYKSSSPGIRKSAAVKNSTQNDIKNQYENTFGTNCL